MTDEEGKSGRKECNKCSYLWTYTGKRKYFCCPNCMTSSQHKHLGVA